MRLVRKDGREEGVLVATGAKGASSPATLSALIEMFSAGGVRRSNSSLFSYEVILPPKWLM